MPLAPISFTRRQIRTAGVLGEDRNVEAFSETLPGVPLLVADPTPGDIANSAGFLSAVLMVRPTDFAVTCTPEFDPTGLGVALNFETAFDPGIVCAANVWTRVPITLPLLQVRPMFSGFGGDVPQIEWTIVLQR